jgi:hypothetical protein
VKAQCPVIVAETTSDPDVQPTARRLNYVKSRKMHGIRFQNFPLLPPPLIIKNRGGGCRLFFRQGSDNGIWHLNF